jgi:hypothetical protein
VTVVIGYPYLETLMSPGARRRSLIPRQGSKSSNLLSESVNGLLQPRNSVTKCVVLGRRSRIVSRLVRRRRERVVGKLIGYRSILLVIVIHYRIPFVPYL